VRPLTANRKVPAVTQAAIAPDIHQPFDIEGNLLTKLPLNFEIRIDDIADPADLILGEILDARIPVNVGHVENTA
jgi:hypothetical protein